ncbi:MAG: hypothetical protein QM529_01750 [Hydrotalea sp.]|nr:hypothetical protein [Hydrotalea sp.]
MTDEKKNSNIFVAPNGRPSNRGGQESGVASVKKGDGQDGDEDSGREFITLLNVSYDTREDRLTLKIATNQAREFCFWITQRLYKKMADMFENIERQVLVNPRVPLAKQDEARAFQKENTLAKQNFDVHYPNKEELVRIFGDQPLLVDKVEAVFNNEFVQFTVSSSEMQATLPLHQETVTALRHLMDSAADRGDWLSLEEQKEKVEPRILN